VIYPHEELQGWLRKTGLHIEEYSCPNCGKRFETTVPVLMSDYCGLESPIHECGPAFTKVVMAPRSVRKKKLWREIFDDG
jgi:hypothetical protein